ARARKRPARSSAPSTLRSAGIGGGPYPPGWRLATTLTGRRERPSMRTMYTNSPTAPSTDAPPTDTDLDALLAPLRDAQYTPARCDEMARTIAEIEALKALRNAVVLA